MNAGRMSLATGPGVVAMKGSHDTVGTEEGVYVRYMNVYRIQRLTIYKRTNKSYLRYLASACVTAMAGNGNGDGDSDGEKASARRARETTGYI